MIDSHLIYKDCINSNKIKLLKKPGISAMIAKSKTR